MLHDDHPFAHAFKDSLPVLAAYIPLGIVFGFLFGQTDYPWVFAPIISLIVYAGAVQFMALSIITIHGSLVELAIATFLLSSRNIFYGLPFLKRFEGLPFFKKFYFIMNMVDSNFSILAAKKLPDPQHDINYCLYLNLFTHSYWVLGTLIGVIIGEYLPEIRGAEFVLVALFTVLATEQYKKIKSPQPFIFAIISASFALIVYPSQLLVISILLCLSLLIVSEYKENKA